MAVAIDVGIGIQVRDVATTAVPRYGMSWGFEAQVIATSLIALILAIIRGVQYPIG